MRDKREVQKLVNLENPKPFVYASGRYGNEFNKATVAVPLAPGRNGNVLVYDLRYDLGEVSTDTWYPIVKELCYNKCPAVAPVAVLDMEDGWSKIGLSREVVERNLKDRILGYSKQYRCR